MFTSSVLKETQTTKGQWCQTSCKLTAFGPHCPQVETRPFTLVSVYPIYVSNVGLIRAFTYHIIPSYFQGPNDCWHMDG